MTTSTDRYGLETSIRSGCELFVYSLAGGTGERAVRNANDATHNDVHGTIWRGRIAWTREFGSGKAAGPVVYTKTLTAPRSQPSRRLPGVPARVRGNVEPIVTPTTDRNVQALELRGDNLAVIVNYACAQCSGFGYSEVRLDKVAAGTSGRVALLVSGSDAQGFAGPSLFDGRLAWYRGCGACLTSYVGPWRYRLSTRSYGRGTPGPFLRRRLRRHRHTSVRDRRLRVPAEPARRQRELPHRQDHPSHLRSRSGTDPLLLTGPRNDMTSVGRRSGYIPGRWPRRVGPLGLR